jgi:hypothetical protein
MLIWAGPALALPTTFNFVSGSVHITANVVGETTFLVDTVVALDGAFVDFDDSPVEIPDFSISIAPTGPIAMSGTYGGYDVFSIDSAVLTPGTLFSSSGVLVGGTEYSVSMGPIDVDAVYSASDTVLPIIPPVAGVPISFTNPSLSATVDTDLVTFEMMGVTLGIIPGALVGETSDLIVKGDITFVGVIPEPATGLMLGLGLVALSVSLSRSTRTS